MMSKKVSERLRVRNNQRRSRARKKEYTEELESRLRNLERQGVIASTEIQAAARKVIKENALLWDFIWHAGHSTESVQHHLRLRGNEAAGPYIAKPTQKLQHGQINDLAAKGISQLEPYPHGTLEPADRTPQLEHKASEHSLSTTGPTHRTEPQGKPLQDNSIPYTPQSEISMGQDDNGVDCNSAQRENSSPQDQHSTPQLAPPTLCRNTNAHERRTDQLQNATSCEAAARIIAGMRGNLSPEDIEEELGCIGNSDCVVDNMIVFEAMDR